MKRVFFTFLSLVTFVFSDITKVHFAEEINWPPFTPNKNGYVQEGMSYELIHEVFSRLNIEVDLELFPMKRVLLLIQHGKKDGATVISKNSQRSQFIEYSDPIFQKRGYIYYLKERKEPIVWNSFEDLKGLKIGVVLGNNYGNEFNEAVKKYGLILEKSGSIEKSFEKLLLKRVDCVLSIDLSAQYLFQNDQFSQKIVNAPKTYYEKNYHIGFSKFTEAKTLLPKVNQIIKEMQLDGSLEKIRLKYIK